jgi:GxxExxY protein
MQNAKDAKDAQKAQNEILNLDCTREIIGAAVDVQSSVFVELKAIESTNEAHRAQLLSYLKVSGHKLGLLMNFNVFPVTKGTHRLVNNL